MRRRLSAAALVLAVAANRVTKVLDLVVKHEVVEAANTEGPRAFVWAPWCVNRRWGRGEDCLQVGQSWFGRIFFEFWIVPNAATVPLCIG